MADTVTAGLGPASDARAGPLARILCVVETEPRPSAADFAALLAKQWNAELRLFFVVENRNVRVAPEDLSYAERSLDAIAARLRTLHGRVRISTAITVGEPDEEIARHARLIDADLVIVVAALGDAATAGRARRIATSTGQPVLEWTEEVMPG